MFFIEIKNALMGIKQNEDYIFLSVYAYEIDKLKI